jgi:molybdopterin-guanine dinucleotide biosynthesis protein A
MKEARTDIAAVILAGGENRRFPSLKGFIEINGVPLIRRTLDLLSGMFREVFISTNAPESYFHLGYPLIGDVLPSRGPMSGIYTTLLNARSEAVLVVACDMPFPGAAVINLLAQRYAAARQSGSVQAVVPVYDNKPQPLLGIYTKAMLPRLEENIMNGKTALGRFLQEEGVHFVDEISVRAADPEGRSFININTVEDYDKVLADEVRRMAHGGVVVVQ